MHIMDAMSAIISLVDPLPPQREWVGLTEDEMSMIGYAVNGNEFEAMRLAEAKLKGKNNGL